MIETSDQTTPEVRNAQRLYHWGVGCSVAYLVALGVYAVSVRGLMFAMKPDEFATFLSGAFAPLAFLWLVLGFRQQGDELRNSAQALWLQGEELRNSVEQQRQLVEVSREQLSAEHAERMRYEQEQDKLAQPRLIISSGGGSKSGARKEFRFSLVSAGPACTNVMVIANGRNKLAKPLISAHDDIMLKFEYDEGKGDKLEPLFIDVQYTDERGGRRQQSFFVATNEAEGSFGLRFSPPTKVNGYQNLDVKPIEA